MAELVDTNSATAKASDIRNGKTAYVKSGLVEGTIPAQVGSTVIPRVASQTVVERGKYMAGDIVMEGDANLKPENIAKGVTMFGVKGTWEGEPPPPGLPEGFYEIDVQSNNPDGGIANGGGVASLGMTVTIDAELVDKEHKRFEFVEWRENGKTVTDKNAYIISKVDSSHNFTAVFDGPKYSAIGLSWESSGEFPYTGNFSKIAYGDGQFILTLGETTNKYLYSTDGSHWELGAFSYSAFFNLLASNGDRFVASNTYDYRVEYKAKDTAFKASNLTSSSSSKLLITDLGIGSNWIAALIGNGTSIYESSNASSWYAKTPKPPSGTWIKISNFGSDYILFSNSAIAYMSSASAWSTVRLPKSMNDISNNGEISTNKRVSVVVGKGNIVYRSTNSVEWTPYTLPYDSNWVSVSYANGTGFVALSDDGKIAHSTDGMSWNGYELPESDVVWEHIAGGDGKFVVTSRTKILYSNDLTVWNEPYGQINTLEYYDIYSVAFGGDKFVLLPYGSSDVFYSKDGTLWENSSMPSVSNWKYVSYGAGKFVAIISGSNEFAYSFDGISWESSQLPKSGDWNKMIYGRGRFIIATSNSSILLHSVDGMNWLESSLPSAGNWRIGYGEYKFVALAYNSNKAAFSEHGIEWESFEMPQSDAWSDIAYGNGRFVAVVYNSDRAVYSEDGKTWAYATLPFSAKWELVCFGDDKFIAMADGQKAAFSTNGMDWEIIELPSNFNWRSIAYGNGRFVSAGLSSKFSIHSI